MYKKSAVYIFLATNFIFTFAQSCSIAGDDAPDPASIACILSRVIAIALAVVGSVFIAMVAYGAIKLAMALGDPKGYAGAISTWQYALMGLGAVIGVFGILSIVGKLVGIDLNPSGLTGQLQGAINALFSSLTGVN
jgi:hypothetical protein